MNRIIHSLAFLILASCAKDQTVEDYTNAQFVRDLSQFKAVEGSYTGNVIDPKTGKAIAAVALDLQADVGTTSSTTGKDQQKTVMRSKLTFLNQQKATISSQNCTYTPGTGVLSADSTVSLAGSVGSSATSSDQTATGGDSVSVKFVAGINQGHISGSIFADGHRDQQLLIEMDLNGPSVEQVAAKIQTLASYSGTDQLFYHGKVNFPGDSGCVATTGCEANLTISRTDVNEIQEFVGLFYFRHPVTLHLDFGGGADFILPGAKLDWDSGTLKSSPAPVVVTKPDGSRVDLGILGFDCNLKSDQSWACSINVSRSLQKIEAHFVKDADSKLSPSGLRLPSIAKKYKGSVVESSGDVYSLEMQVVSSSLTGLSALQELINNSQQKYFKIYLDYRNPKTIGQDVVMTLPFSSGVYDNDYKSLVANEPGAIAGTTLSIDCKNFDLARVSGGFKCDLITPRGVNTLDMDYNQK